MRRLTNALFYATVAALFTTCIGGLAGNTELARISLYVAGALICPLTILVSWQA